MNNINKCILGDLENILIRNILFLFLFLFFNILFLFKGMATFEDIPELQAMVIKYRNGKGKISREAHKRAQELGFDYGDACYEWLNGAYIRTWAENLIKELAEEEGRAPPPFPELPPTPPRKPRTIIQMRDDPVEQLQEFLNYFKENPKAVRLPVAWHERIERLGYVRVYGYNKKEVKEWINKRLLELEHVKLPPPTPKLPPPTPKLPPPTPKLPPPINPTQQLQEILDFFEANPGSEILTGKLRDIICDLGYLSWFGFDKENVIEWVNKKLSEHPTQELPPPTPELPPPTPELPPPTPELPPPTPRPKTKTIFRDDPIEQLQNILNYFEENPKAKRLPAKHSDKIERLGYTAASYDLSPKSVVEWINKKLLELSPQESTAPPPQFQPPTSYVPIIQRPPPPPRTNKYIHSQEYYLNQQRKKRD
jgi:hypothetical protein